MKKPSTKKAPAGPLPLSSSGTSSSSSNNNNNNSSTSSSSGSGSQRTIQVKIGNQAAQAMTPDQAADYLKTLSSQGWGAAGREVKMTFGGSGSLSSVGVSATATATTTSTSSSSLTSASVSSSSNSSSTTANHLASILSSDGTTLTVGKSSVRSVSNGASSSSSSNINNNTASVSSSLSTKDFVPPKRNSEMPCSEKEMKALMSMFVEIMGLQMNTDRLNKVKSKTTKRKKQTSSSNSSDSNLFQFPQNIPPPPGGWPEDLLWPVQEDDDDDDDDADENQNGHRNHDLNDTDYDPDEDEHAPRFPVPGLEDIPLHDRAQWLKSTRTKYISGSSAPVTSSTPSTSSFSWTSFTSSSSSSSSASNNTATGGRRATAADVGASYRHPMLQTHAATEEERVVTGLQGIVPFEWEALERVAVEEALEQEERTRKANRKRETRKATRKKTVQAAKEAAAKQAEVAQKKRERDIVTWRGRVVATCQSNEVATLEQLLEESPLRKDDQSDSTRAHLEYLVPASLAKNRQLIEKGKEAREKLLEYLLDMAPALLLEPLRNGRSALHTACFFSDLDSLERMIQIFAELDLDINETCQESGWAPLHYAALSGSMQAVELLLCHGCDALVVTSEAHTWYTSDGHGLTPSELAQAVFEGSCWTGGVESHGMALTEISNSLLNNPSERPRYRIMLERMVTRLDDVETNGYSPLDDDELRVLEEIDEELLLAAAAASSGGGSGHPSSAAGNTPSSSSSSSQPSTSTTSNLEDSDEAEADGGGGELGEDSDDVSPKSNAAEEGGKKGKKKKNSSNNKKSATASAGDNASKEESEPVPDTSTTVVPAQPDPEITQDPVVVALLGMGFDQGQILSGVEACGGIHRATADDVVAWIFAQDASSEDAGGNADSSGNAPSREDTKDGEINSSDTNTGALGEGQKPQAGSVKTTSSSAVKNVESGAVGKTGIAKMNKRVDSDPAFHQRKQQNQEEEDQRRREVEKKRQEEERVAAERLAAKREEQRRRNREWNKRQRHEAQAKAAAEAKANANSNLTTARNVLAPASSVLAPAGNYLPSASTGLSQQQQQQQQAPQFQQHHHHHAHMSGPGSAPSTQPHHLQNHMAHGSTSSFVPTLHGKSASGANGINSRKPPSGVAGNSSNMYSMHPSIARHPIEHVQSHETSTVASSNGGGGYGEDDDATVSTLGSSQPKFTVGPSHTTTSCASAPSVSPYSSSGFGGAHPPPLQPATSSGSGAPPGFESTGTTSSSFSAVAPPQPMREIRATARPFVLNSSSSAAVHLPPGIPEAGPLLDHPVHRVPSATSSSFSGLSSSSRGGFVTGSGGFLSVGDALSSSNQTVGMGGQNPLSSTLASTTTGLGSSLFLPESSLSDGASTGLDRVSSPPSVPRGVASSMSANPVIGASLGGFGSTDPALESSIIDSISTGNSMIGGSSLWGSSGDSPVMSSSLLGNIIHTGASAGLSTGLGSSSVVPGVGGASEGSSLLGAVVGAANPHRGEKTSGLDFGIGGDPDEVLRQQGLSTSAMPWTSSRTTASSTAAHNLHHGGGGANGGGGTASSIW